MSEHEAQCACGTCLNRRITKLEARLAAAGELAEKWREEEATELVGPVKDGNDCADELEALLKGGE